MRRLALLATGLGLAACATAPAPTFSTPTVEAAPTTPVLSAPLAPLATPAGTPAVATTAPAVRADAPPPPGARPSAGLPNVAGTPRGSATSGAVLEGSLANSRPDVLPTVIDRSGRAPPESVRPRPLDSYMTPGTPPPTNAQNQEQWGRQLPTRSRVDF